MLKEGHLIDSEEGGLFLRLKEMAGYLGERALQVVSVVSTVGFVIEGFAGVDFEVGISHPLDVKDEL